METTCFHGELEDLELVRERIFSLSAFFPMLPILRWRWRQLASDIYTQTGAQIDLQLNRRSYPFVGGSGTS